MRRICYLKISCSRSRSWNNHSSRHRDVCPQDQNWMVRLLSSFDYLSRVAHAMIDRARLLLLEVNFTNNSRRSLLRSRAGGGWTATDVLLARWPSEDTSCFPDFGSRAECVQVLHVVLSDQRVVLLHVEEYVEDVGIWRLGVERRSIPMRRSVPRWRS